MNVAVRTARAKGRVGACVAHRAMASSTKNHSMSDPAFGDRNYAEVSGLSGGGRGVRRENADPADDRE